MQHRPAAEAQQVQGSAHPPAMAAAAAVAPAAAESEATVTIEDLPDSALGAVLACVGQNRWAQGCLPAFLRTFVRPHRARLDTCQHTTCLCHPPRRAGHPACCWSASAGAVCSCQTLRSGASFPAVGMQPRSLPCCGAWAASWLCSASGIARVLRSVIITINSFFKTSCSSTSLCSCWLAQSPASCSS